ncbi:MAG: hypothetical protein AAF755_10385 [Pseudomonadota bacterium]
MDRRVTLQDYLNSCRAKQFTPGQFDCALFAAGWLDVLHGSRLVDTYAGRYASEAAGRRLLRAEGRRNLLDLCASHVSMLGNWMAAAPGDIALVRDQRRLCFGVVGVGGKIHCVFAGGGLTTCDLSSAVKVGRP